MPKYSALLWQVQKIEREDSHSALRTAYQTIAPSGMLDHAMEQPS